MPMKTLTLDDTEFSLAGASVPSTANFLGALIEFALWPRKAKDTCLAGHAAAPLEFVARYGPRS